MHDEHCKETLPGSGSNLPYKAALIVASMATYFKGAVEEGHTGVVSFMFPRPLKGASFARLPRAPGNGTRGDRSINHRNRAKRTGAVDRALEWESGPAADRLEEFKNNIHAGILAKVGTSSRVV